MESGGPAVLLLLAHLLPIYCSLLRYHMLLLLRHRILACQLLILAGVLRSEGLRLRLLGAHVVDERNRCRVPSRLAAESLYRLVVLGELWLKR